MGQENSTPIDPSVPPTTLKSRNLSSLATYLSSPKCTKVAVLTGAGISTSAGIPDFRTPGTGLYSKLADIGLPYPEAIFDISYFRNKPEAFYALAKELYPGAICPTITHSFLVLLHRKEKLLMHFTQNIECLDREAGLPGDKIVEAHGSFAEQSCIECKKPYPKDLIMQHVADGSVPICMACNGGYVKPDITFFGEALPRRFFEKNGLVRAADLVLVMGTSLQVGPFNHLPEMAGEETPRVLINLEQAGSLGSRRDDVLLLGDCDTRVKELAEACGWLGELLALHKEVTLRFPGAAKEEAPVTVDGHRDVDAEVSKLAEEVDRQVKISEDHVSRSAYLKEQIREDVEGAGEGPKVDPASLKEKSSEKQSTSESVSKDESSSSTAKPAVSSGATDTSGKKDTSNESASTKGNL